MISKADSKIVNFSSETIECHNDLRVPVSKLIILRARKGKIRGVLEIGKIRRLAIDAERRACYYLPSYTVRTRANPFFFFTSSAFTASKVHYSHFFRIYCRRSYFMSGEFILRIVGMIAFAGAGGYWGFWFAAAQNQNIPAYTIAIGLVGALFGLIATPYFTTRPIRWLRTFLVRVSAETLLTGLTGL